jgi:hypothetical protein
MDTSVILVIMGCDCYFFVATRLILPGEKGKEGNGEILPSPLVGRRAGDEGFTS